MNAMLEDYLELETVGEPCPRIKLPAGQIPASFLGDCTRVLARDGASPDYVQQFASQVCQCRNDDAVRRMIRRYFQLEF